MNFAIVLFVVCAAVVEVLAGPQGRSDDPWKAAMKKCAMEVNLRRNDYTVEKHTEQNPNPKIKCYFACLLKKTGAMLDDGTINKEHVIHNIRPDIPEEQREQFRRRFAACADISREDECDTAYDFFKCSDSTKISPPQ